MLAPEMVAKFHDFGKPDSDIVNGQTSNSWMKRDFSSDEDSHHSFVTSVMSQPNLPSPLRNGMTSSLQSNEVFDPIKQEVASPNPVVMDTKMTSPQNDVTSTTKLNFSDTSPKDRCRGCNGTITDRFVHQISGMPYHEKCSRCSACGRSLTSSCYVRGGKLYCKDDYLRVRKICSGCDTQIQDGEMMMRLVTSSTVYHVTCFKCEKCDLNLKKGDKYIVNSESNNNGESGIICQRCWESSCGDVRSDDAMESGSAPVDVSGDVNMLQATIQESDDPKVSRNNSTNDCDVIDLMTSPKSHSSVASPKSDDMGEISDDDDKDENLHDSSINKDDGEEKDGNNDKEESDSKRAKRPRTILNAVQRRAFKAAFEMSPKPCRKVREALASETGLSVRVVQVWFQNQRAKMKKLAKRQQSREQAMAIKAREQFGFHGFDPMTSLPHHPMFTSPHDGMIENGFGHFPHYPNDVPVWERMHGPPSITYHGCPETMSLPLHDQMPPSDDLSPSRFGDYNSYHHQGMMGGAPVDHSYPSNHNVLLPEPHMNQPIRSDDLGTPIDGLFSMQNNYFTT